MVPLIKYQQVQKQMNLKQHKIFDLISELKQKFVNKLTIIRIITNHHNFPYILINLQQVFSYLVSKQMQEDIYSAKKLPNGIIQVKLNNKYQMKQGDQFYEVIQLLIPDLNFKNNKTTKHFDKNLGIKFFSSLEFKLGKCNMQQQKCTICLCEFQIKDVEKEIVQDSEQDVYSLPCSHIYHRNCIKNMLGTNKWLKCPVCSTIYGRMLGDQPEGKMTHYVDHKMKCQGYPVGTIVIQYSFGGCKRNGVNVPGTSRTAYLPNNPEGNQVLALLKQCFERKLTFTVGRSVTTGMDNQIVWNGIHHKTGLHGGSASFGYPDPTYLKRVKQQLAAKGIIPPKK